MNDGQFVGLIFLGFLAYGFYKYRKWLKEYFISWWYQMKIAWKGGKDGR